MTKKLTEEMVIARTKISDLSKIKRLNCWGSELVDISLLRSIPNVEVLSLSINKINSLADFQYCRRLEELYIRQNDIRDLNEVVYLQNLTNLKYLWLAENPCSLVDGYRLAVIKALPQLQKLDNVVISQEELREAQRHGKVLYHPDNVQEESEDEYIPQTQTHHQQQQSPPQQYSRYQDYSDSEYSTTKKSPTRSQEVDYDLEDSEDQYPREDVSEESKDYSPLQQSSPSRQEQVRRSYSPDEQHYIERRRNSYDRESPKQQRSQYYDKTSSTTTINSVEEPQSSFNGVCTFRESKIATSQSTSCIKEYTNGDKYIQSQYRNDSVADVSSIQGHEKRYICSAANHRSPFGGRRPVTRNSNILSAVLCLVKELDYPSLEVVEMAVNCRMEELNE